MRLAFVIALIGIAAVAFGAPTTSMPGSGGSRIWEALDDPDLTVKWVQTPDGLSGLSSQLDDCYPFFSQVADDFLCDATGPILAIEWWGSYSDVPPTGHHFMIEFWSDNPGPPSHPDQMLYQEPCYVFTEEYDPDYEQYHYVQYFDNPFWQEEGTVYWVSIYSVFCFPPQWYWCTGGPQWNDCASFKSEFFGYPEWTDAVTVWGVCYDMAFVLYGEFIVPVEDKTWGSIKALYQ